MPRVRTALARLFGRDPVVVIALITSATIGALPLLGWNPTVTAAAIATATALGGALSGALVAVDRVLPLVVGLSKSVLTLILALGVHLPENHVAAAMAFLTLIAGFATRTQVGAVEPPRVRGGTAVGSTSHRDRIPGGILDVAPNEMTQEQARDFARRLRELGGWGGPADPQTGEQRTEVLRPTVSEQTAYTASHATALQQLDDQSVHAPRYDGQHERSGGERRGRHWLRGRPPGTVSG
jgi:hypothetical protein